MLRFVNDPLKTKKLWKSASKKLSFVIKYVLDQYKNKEMCNKVVLEIRMLGFILDCCRDKK